MPEPGWRPENDGKIQAHLEAVLRVRPGSLPIQVAFEYDRRIRVLAHIVNAPRFPAVEDRIRIVHKAVNALDDFRPRVGREPREAFREALASAARSVLRERTQTYGVVYPIHLAPTATASFRRITINGVLIRRTSWPRLARDFDLREWWGRAIDRVGVRRPDAKAFWSTHFTPLLARADARSPVDAWKDTSPAFELLRVVLNAQSSWGSVYIAGGRSPFARILPPPLMAVLPSSRGSRVFLTSGRYEWATAQPRPDFRHARDTLRVLTRPPHDVRERLESALLRYGGALDAQEWRQSYLALWQVLEILTLQSAQQISMKDVAKKVALLLGRQSLDRDLLDALSSTRNRLVHAGEFPLEQGLEEVQHLKHLVERTLAAVVGWSRELPKKQGLGLLYSALGCEDAELRARGQIGRAVMRRRKRSSPIDSGRRTMRRRRA